MNSEWHSPVIDTGDRCSSILVMIIIQSSDLISYGLGPILAQNASYLSPLKLLLEVGMVSNSIKKGPPTIAI